MLNKNRLLGETGGNRRRGQRFLIESFSLVHYFDTINLKSGTLLKAFNVFIKLAADLLIYYAVFYTCIRTIFIMKPSISSLNNKHYY